MLYLRHSVNISKFCCYHNVVFLKKGLECSPSKTYRHSEGVYMSNMVSLKEKLFSFSVCNIVIIVQLVTALIFIGDRKHSCRVCFPEV